MPPLPDVGQHGRGNRNRADGQPIEAASDLPSFPLSRGQWRLWYQQAVQPADSSLNLRLAARLRDRTGVPQVVKAVSAVVSRQEVLRTVIRPGHGSTVRQVVLADMTSPIGTTCHDDELISPAQLVEAVTAAAASPFDLQQESPFRATVVASPSGQALGVQFVAHHVCWDAFSTAILWRDLSHELARTVNGNAYIPQYHQFAVLEATDALREVQCAAVNRVVEQVRGWAPVEPRSVDQPVHDNLSDLPCSIRFTFSEQQIRAPANDRRPTRFTIIVAAVARSLFRTLGRDSVRLAFDVSLRGDLAQFDETIGMFQSQVISQLTRCPDDELLSQASLSVLEALENRWAPYDDVVRRLGWAGMLEEEPFDAKVSFEQVEVTDLVVDPVVRWTDSPRHNLTFAFTVYPNATIGCSVSSRSERYRPHLAPLQRELMGSLSILLREA